MARLIDGSPLGGAQIFRYDLAALTGASSDSFQFTVSNSSSDTSSQVFPLTVV